MHPGDHPDARVRGAGVQAHPADGVGVGQHGLPHDPDGDGVVVVQRASDGGGLLGDLAEGLLAVHALASGEEPDFASVRDGHGGNNSVRWRVSAGRIRSGSGRAGDRCPPVRSAPAGRAGGTGECCAPRPRHITAALTAARASAPMVNTPWLRISTAGERWPDRVSTMPRPMESSPIRANGPTGIAAPNSSAHRGQHARHRFAPRRPGARVRRVGVHYPADVRHVPVDIRVGGSVARRGQLAVDDGAIQIADDHRVGGQLVVGHATRLDHQQVVARHPRRDVAGGPDHQLISDQLGVQRRDLPAQAGNGTGDSGSDGGHRWLAPFRRRRRRCSTSLLPSPRPEK